MGEQDESRSRLVALIAVLTAMAVVLDSLPMIPGFYSGVWDSWIFMISPLIGVLLGPSRGAVSVVSGTIVGHLIYPRDPFEFVFMLGAPVGAAVAGFIFEGRWAPAVALDTTLLSGYFLTPVSWSLPLWGLWDVLAGYGLLLLAASHGIRGRFSVGEGRESMLIIALSTVIGLESDIMMRLFMLIPCQTYWLFYGFTVEQLLWLWIGGAFVTPLKVAIATALALAVGKPLLRIRSQITGLAMSPEEVLSIRE